MDPVRNLSNIIIQLEIKIKYLMCMQLKIIFTSLIFKIVSLFLAGPVLHCYTWAFLVAGEWGYFLVAMHRLLIVAVLLLQSTGY